MNNDRQRRKKERRELKREEKERAQRQSARRRTAKHVFVVALIILILGGAILAIVNYAGSKPEVAEGDVVSEKGIHWHPKLSISIKGEKQEIPANIGIGVTHAELHTHDATGVVHMEMRGLVTRDETTVGAFFKTWGKRFDANCIFEFCNGPDGSVKMTVNGEPNAEFDRYALQDNDVIEIRYE